MLISIDKRFVFLFPTKTGSTSISAMLSKYSDVSMSTVPNLKHLSFREVDKIFRSVLDNIGDDLKVVSVVRDPLQRLYSLYRSHAEETFMDIDHLYTGNMDFEEFVDSWCVRNLPQLRSTKNMCSGLNGEFVADYLISFDNLEDDLTDCLSYFNIPTEPIQRLNVSSRLKQPSTYDIDVSLYSKLMGGDDRNLEPFTGKFLTIEDKKLISNLA